MRKGRWSGWGLLLLTVTPLAAASQRAYERDPSASPAQLRQTRAEPSTPAGGAAQRRVDTNGTPMTPVSGRPSDPWLERTPYEIPFADHAAWLAFMAEGGANTSALAAAIPGAEFGRLVDGSLSSVERVRFPSDSLVLWGILVRPPGEGPFPAVLYARGENGSEGSPELGGGDVEDVLAAVAALGEWEDSDTTRLGLVGVSRGGLVAAWTRTRTSAVDAAVLLAPDLDLEDTARRRPAMDSAVLARSVPGYAEARERALRDASPLHAVEDTGHDLTDRAAEVRRASVGWLARYVPGLQAPANDSMPFDEGVER